MNLQKGDMLVTGLVTTAGVLYLLWLLDVVPAAKSDVGVTGSIILALGRSGGAVRKATGHGLKTATGGRRTAARQVGME